MFHRSMWAGPSQYSSEVQQQGINQALPEALERIACLLIGDLGVDLHRDFKVGVPQDLHGHPRVHVQIGEQRPAGASGIVHGDPTDTRLFAAAIPESKEVSRLDRSTEPLLPLDNGDIGPTETRR